MLDNVCQTFQHISSQILILTHTFFYVSNILTLITELYLSGRISFQNSLDKGAILAPKDLIN